MQTAETGLKTAKDNASKEQSNVKVATEEFNKMKLEKMQILLKNMVDIQTIHHKKILDSVATVKVKADAIKVEEESKI